MKCFLVFFNLLHILALEKISNNCLDITVPFSHPTNKMICMAKFTATLFAISETEKYLSLRNRDYSELPPIYSLIPEGPEDSVQNEGNLNVDSVSMHGSLSLLESRHYDKYCLLMYYFNIPSIRR